MLIGRCAMTVQLRRPVADPPFNVADEGWLAFVLEHALKAMERICRYASARRSAQLLAAALETVPWPVMVADAAGQILYRNAAAVPALSRGDVEHYLDLVRAGDPNRWESSEAPAVVTIQGEDHWQIRLVRLPDDSRAAILSQPHAAASAAVELPAGNLSCREREVTDLVAHGLTNVQIARALSITQNTVKRHLKSAFRKSGVNSRAELVAQVLRRGGVGAGA